MAGRPLHRRLALAGLGVLLFAAVLEAALRLLHPASDALRSWVSVPQDAHDFGRAGTTAELLEMSLLGYQPLARHAGFVSNSRGFRTAEYSPAKEPGTLRLLALGDSFTFASGGVPYGDLWTTVLQQRLQSSLGRPVELINLGVPAVGPSFEWRLWQLEGRRLQADLVLLALFVGNDFTDEGWVPGQGLFAQWGRASYAARVLRNLLRGRVPRLAGRGRAAPPSAPASGAAERLGGYELDGWRTTFATLPPPYSAAQLLTIEARDMAVCDRARASRFAPLRELMAGVLSALHAEIAASGAGLLVVIVPARFQVDEADRAAALVHARRSETDFDWEAPQRWLAAWLEQRGIPYVDLLPALRAAALAGAPGSGGGLYNPGDTHWSPAGNAVAAAELAARLQGMLSGPGAGERDAAEAATPPARDPPRR